MFVRPLAFLAALLLLAAPAGAMQKRASNVVDQRGNVIEGTTVTVYTSSGALATIYSDDGVTTKANPITVDADDGAYFYYAANGRYSETLAASGRTFDSTQTSDIVLYDPEDDRESIVRHGAICDGTTNVSAALIAAIAALPSTGGVVYSPGNCRSIMVNAQISITKDNVTLDFGTTTIKNTTEIATEVYVGQTICPVFRFTGNYGKVIGGIFTDFVSHPIFFGGVGLDDNRNGATVIGTRITGLRIGASRGGDVDIQVRHMTNTRIEGVTILDSGAPSATGSTKIKIERGGPAILARNIIRDSVGNGMSFLDITGGTITGNVVTGLSNTGFGDVLGLHVKQSTEIAITGNSISVTGGSATKLSEENEDITFSGNVLELLGTQAEAYAALHMEGTTKFTVSSNEISVASNEYGIRATMHSATNMREGLIALNRITVTPQPGDTVRDGGCILLVQDSTLPPMGPVAIKDNVCRGAPIQIQTNVINASVTGNTIILDTDVEGTFNAALVLDRATESTVRGNDIRYLNATPVAGERYGIYIAGASARSIVDSNTISWPNGATNATATFDDGSATTAVISYNTAHNATTARHSGSAVVRHHYETGTYTVTLTSCGSATTGTARWTLNGNVVTLFSPALTCTSNDVTKTLTGMPTDLLPSNQVYFAVFTQDNGGAYVAATAVLATSGVITLNTSANDAGWTGSGTASVRAFTITFRRL